MWGLMTLKKRRIICYENVLSKFQEKLPSTMIFFSSIFHRNDRKYENKINDINTFLKSLFSIMPATGLHLEGMGTTRIQKEYGSYLLVEMDTICFISTYCI